MYPCRVINLRRHIIIYYIRSSFFFKLIVIKFRCPKWHYKMFDINVTWNLQRLCKIRLSVLVWNGRMVSKSPPVFSLYEKKKPTTSVYSITPTVFIYKEKQLRHVHHLNIYDHLFVSLYLRKGPVIHINFTISRKCRNWNMRMKHPG